MRYARVNGQSKHLLYEELTKTPEADCKAGRIIWNFEKFLISPSDEVRLFRPTTEHDSPEVISALKSFLPQLAQ